MHRSALARFLTIFFAALQLAAPSVASVADARVERESERSPRAAAHLEVHGSSQCPRVHPTDCGLCRLLTAHASPAAPPPTIPVADSSLAACPEARIGARTGNRFAFALPRAPPSS